jgi:hypothetical protein
VLLVAPGQNKVYPLAHSPLTMVMRPPSGAREDMIEFLASNEGQGPEFF